MILDFGCLLTLIVTNCIFSRAQIAHQYYHINVSPYARYVKGQIRVFFPFNLRECLSIGAQSLFDIMRVYANSAKIVRYFRVL